MTKVKTLLMEQIMAIIAWYDKDGNYFSHKVESSEGGYEGAKKKYGLYGYKDTGIGVTGSNGEYDWGY